jgi:hypothetical protein
MLVLGNINDNNNNAIAPKAEDNNHGGNNLNSVNNTNNNDTINNDTNSNSNRKRKPYAVFCNKCKLMQPCATRDLCKRHVLLCNKILQYKCTKTGCAHYGFFATDFHWKNWAKKEQDQKDYQDQGLNHRYHKCQEIMSKDEVAQQLSLVYEPKSVKEITWEEYNQLKESAARALKVGQKPVYLRRAGDGGSSSGGSGSDGEKSPKKSTKKLLKKKSNTTTVKKETASKAKVENNNNNVNIDHFSASSGDEDDFMCKEEDLDDIKEVEQVKPEVKPEDYFPMEIATTAFVSVDNTIPSAEFNDTAPIVHNNYSSNDDTTTLKLELPQVIDANDISAVVESVASTGVDNNNTVADDAEEETMQSDVELLDAVNNNETVESSNLATGVNNRKNKANKLGLVFRKGKTRFSRKKKQISK